MSVVQVFGMGLLVLAAAGCASGDRPAANSSCAGEASAVLDGIDWQEAATFDVRIRQQDFAPAVFGLLRDRPYVLRLTNEDDGRHGFASREFFKNVAVESASVNGEALDATCLSSIGLPPGAVAEIRLVAVRDGRYAFDSGTTVDLGVGYTSGHGIGTIFIH